MTRTRHWERYFCVRNFRKYLLETTLHGLRFIGDNSLSVWERIFFLCAFIAVVAATANFISNIYAKWESTPVIIGINPNPTTISDIPFPALTLCNMNQIKLSKVRNYSSKSVEGAMMDIACLKPIAHNENDMPENYKNNNLSFTNFLDQNSQPCSNLIISCYFNSFKRNCSDLFRDEIADEGQCCVFNLLHPTFRYKQEFQIGRDYTNFDGAIPVSWSSEKGYPADLPAAYYPRKASGIGINVGLSIILNAEIDDYFCASTNGPGFKLSLQNPIEMPRVRDVGFTVAPGTEVRVAITARSFTASPLIRPLSRTSRLCLFSDEGDLLYNKIYTRRNCESECEAKYVYYHCKCIPYNLPLIYANATICSAPQAYCEYNSRNIWLRVGDESCRSNCLSSCFDLTFSGTSFATPLVAGTYLVQEDEFLSNFSREYIQNNLAIVHLYYQDFVFYGNMRSIYVGFTEFLSNTGGILSLFLGFSFISLAEMIYYALIRPIFWWKRPYTVKTTAQQPQQRQQQQQQQQQQHRPKTELLHSPNWLGNEIMRPRRAYVARMAPNFNFWNYRHLHLKPIVEIN